MKRFAASLIAMLLALTCQPVAADDGTLRVAVDPRVETASVMARLAGFEEFQGAGIADYDAAVDAHFAAWRDHPSIVALRALREARGIGYAATLELALLATPGDWSPSVRLDPLPATLDARWDAASARQFLAAARQFDADSGASAFFDGQRDVHARAEAAARAALGTRMDLGWYRALPGAGAVDFQLVPALLAGQNNYGLQVVGDDGHRTILGLIGTPPHRAGEAIAYPADALLALLVHEFHHSFVNPWVDANAALLSPAATDLYRAVQARMRQLAYGEPRILLYESLVRAHTQRYLRAHGEEAVLKRVLAEDRGKGFPWTPELATALDALADSGELDNDARVAGRVAAILADWARDDGARVRAEERRLEAEAQARLAMGPQPVAFLPAQGAHVAPGDGMLEVRFDRAMAPALSIFGEVPQVIGKPAWSEDRTTLRIPVRFAADTDYRLQLNTGESMKMASADGQPLAPREWRFSTRQ